jgi:hypothetical protein
LDFCRGNSAGCGLHPMTCSVQQVEEFAAARRFRGKHLEDKLLQRVSFGGTGACFSARPCHPIKPNSFERERINKSQISSANFRMATWCSGQGRKCLGGRKPVAEHEIGGPAWKVQPSRSQTLRQALRGRAKRGDLESSRRNERRTNLQCSCRRTTQLILARSVEWRLIC